MDNIIDRIYKIIDYKSISVSEFSKRIEVSNGYFAKQKTNNANIGSHILEKIVREYSDVNPAWLITGMGDMIISKPEEIQKKSKDESEEYYGAFWDTLNQVQRVVDVIDKDRFSEAYSFVSNKFMIIYEYLEHYSLLNKMESFPEKSTKKELVKNIQQIIKIEKELLKIIAPYKDAIFELYDKISDFDDKHDRVYSIDEDAETMINDILKEE